MLVTTHDKLSGTVYSKTRRLKWIRMFNHVNVKSDYAITQAVIIGVSRQ